MKKISLSLSGMHCSSCAQLIERSLKGVSGVKDAHVNFAAEKALVAFEETDVSVQRLIEAVSNAGYRAEEVHAGDTQHEQKSRRISEHLL